MTEKPEPSDLLAWVDLETTGLDDRYDQILEIAVIITDGHMKSAHYGPNIVIRSDLQTLEAMPEKVREMHQHSGLWDACLASEYTIEDADIEVVHWLRRFEQAGRVPLAGSTVGFDRAFMKTWMPLVHDWFHYRNVDVSTYKETFRRWFPLALAGAPKDKNAHRALADIKESIDALVFFKDYIAGLHQRVEDAILIEKF